MHEPQRVEILTQKHKEEIDCDFATLKVRVEALGQQFDTLWLALAETLTRVQFTYRHQKENKA